MKKFLFALLSLSIISCGEKADSRGGSSESETPVTEARIETLKIPPLQHTSLVILGNVQDAGSPQAGCQKECCADLFENPDRTRQVVSLGLVDIDDGKSYLFEATPDISAQLEYLGKLSQANSIVPNGIFLTHAHIGHYTGLMYLGKEVMDARKVPVYVMPRMRDFLGQNGPWDQLVRRENIALQDLSDGVPVSLSDQLQVTPLKVPHRDEYSETVGYSIQGPEKSALFIPDIDKWALWERDIIAEIQQVDYAFLDATFYSGTELGNRDMNEIPHPFILESLEQFKGLPPEQKQKIIFIHFNHTNPVLDPNSPESLSILELGYRIGRYGDRFPL
ncbi:pyrroloquinoline quinone biosynthesis protein B [Robiginitalea myxolifaciens]|uniref:Pyrroloquinoline quinone biosynthesis protein B n=1 Tax=Robiginitalea myxolifaciens TaxID=400055 RepID=A0A1I6FMT6_9FLAO|nr:MBL fold metallo-hydrolase [Robiginitalea myxolifaciens]SFR31262.1 pyrroloquinoline quinone biosynthesis protein B [Robiginitalea myxolifaciens]